MTADTLLFRADDNARMGAGHVMRCLALAQAWQRAEGQVVFAQAESTAALEKRLRGEGVEVVRLNLTPGSAEDAAPTIAQAHACGALWIVADGYHFGTEWQKQVKDAGFRLLLVDDYGHAEHYYADYVLNQNLSADSSLYEHREHYTKLLLGTRYVLLRQEFLKCREWRREIPEVARRVLVTLGGGDPDNVTLEVIQALQDVWVDGLEAVVVVGGSNPHYEELRAAVRDSTVPIRLERHVTNMPELMSLADVAVSAAGSTCWELAFMGLPSLLLVLTNNQVPTAERLDSMGLAVNLGRPCDCSATDMATAITRLLERAEMRRKMYHRCQALVDGEGASRVLRHMDGSLPSLRHVCEEDCNLLWNWANDPEVRAVSFSSQPIPWEKHVRWFKSKLQDTRCVFYIAVNGGEQPLGQVRYELDGDEAVISIALDAASRSRGYGAAIIRLACRKLFEETIVSTVHAYVKEGNEASVRAFVKAQFKNMGEAIVCGQKAFHLIARKEELS